MREGKEGMEIRAITLSITLRYYDVDMNLLRQKDVYYSVKTAGYKPVHIMLPNFIFKNAIMYSLS